MTPEPRSVAMPDDRVEYDRHEETQADRDREDVERYADTWLGERDDD